MVDSVKKYKEREKLADGKNKINLKQLSTKLLGTHYSTSLMVRGECDWPSIKTDLIFSTPHPLQPDAYYPVTELFVAWTNGGCSF